MQIRTVAAIIAWVVVALLLLNKILMSQWVLPIAIALAIIAVLLYFSPRLRKGKKSDKKRLNQHNPDRITRSSSSNFGLLKLIGNENIND